ncbi:MAG: serine/threonine protein kinase [Nannocystaceae bacterium]|nr:serine/threonine protein kinase [Nannocystaceae bacterium]
MSGSNNDQVTRAIVDTVVTTGDADVPDAPPSLDELAKPGSLLGRYAILGEIGRGGMGVVLRAYDPKLQREVALKVVKAVSAEAEARLVREARAMAQLSHPNVVAIYDVATRGGDSQVVLAMEYVAGETLRQRGKNEERSASEILNLVVQAGRGLAAAHVEGLLHRDFKPDNVLVGHDERVRVTDFGLARPAADRESRASESMTGAGFHGTDTDLTQAGTVLGTPRYMAPEQHRVGPLTPAADQFAYCVTLWEALHSEPPYEGNMEALLRGKLEGPPSWPRGVAVSARVVEAIRRGLHPDPLCRFATMDELLVLLSRPVGLRRRRAALVVGGLVATGGLVVAAQADPTTSVCSGAAQQLGGVWDVSRRGKIEAAFLDGRVAFAPGVWARISPRIDGWAAAWTTMHTDACEATQVRHEHSEVVMDLRIACLHRARLKLDAAVSVLGSATVLAVENAHAVVDELPDLKTCADVEALQAEVTPPTANEATAVRTIRSSLAKAAARRHAGDYDGAHVAVLEAHDGSDEVKYEPVQTEVALELGRVLDDLGRYDEAEAAARRARLLAARLGQREMLRASTLELMHVLGYRLVRPAEAMALLEVVMGLSSGKPLLEASVHNELALILGKQGKFERAEQEQRLALKLRTDALGADNPVTAASRNNLGNVLLSRGEFVAAEVEYRVSLAVRREALGAEHPAVALSRNNLGLALQSQGRYDEALAEHRAALALEVRSLGERHPLVAASHNNLAMVLQMQGELEAAEREYRIAQAGWTAALGPEHPNVASARGNLATVLSSTGRHAEAETEVRALIVLLTKRLGVDHPELAALRHNLAIFLRAQGKLVESEAEYRVVIEQRKRQLGPDHPQLAASLANFGNVLQEAGKLEEAEARYREALALRLRVLAPDHVDLALSRRNLAVVLGARGKSDESIVLFEEAYRATKDSDPPGDRAEIAFDLAQALATQPDRRDEARRLGAEALAGFVEAGDEERRAELKQWLRTLR